MKTFKRNIIITGGAGFIGSHVVRLFVNKYPDYHIINLDKLTYAGNLANLKDIEDRPNYTFVKADICDFEKIQQLMAEFHVDGVIHLAAESHVDRSIKDPFTFARTNVMGTLTLLQAAKLYWESLPEQYTDKLFYHISTDEVFSEIYLDRYFGRDYVVQKAMNQSPFTRQFCKTSVNTIRMAVYRSVKTNRPYVVNAIIRMGKDGSLVDNAHAGGMFVGVNSEGILGKYVCNQYGEKMTVFNGIDFQTNTYQIPNYDKIKSFAELVASALPHQRLLALDIILDENSEPVLLEYNIRAFSVWLFQFTSGVGFGNFTDEIIEYCRLHKKEATRISVIF